MADDCDITGERMEKEAELSEKARQARMANKQVSEYCIDCDERISDERQKATGGCNKCVTCLELEAAKRRHFR